MSHNQCPKASHTVLECPESHTVPGRPTLPQNVQCPILSQVVPQCPRTSRVPYCPRSSHNVPECPESHTVPGRPTLPHGEMWDDHLILYQSVSYTYIIHVCRYCPKGVSHCPRAPRILSGSLRHVRKSPVAPSPSPTWLARAACRLARRAVLKEDQRAASVGY